MNSTNVTQHKRKTKPYLIIWSDNWRNYKEEETDKAKCAVVVLEFVTVAS